MFPKFKKGLLFLGFILALVSCSNDTEENNSIAVEEKPITVFSLDSFNLYFQPILQSDSILKELLNVKYDSLSKIYAENNFRAHWINEFGLAPLGDSLLSFLDHESRYTLDSTDFNTLLVNSLINKAKSDPDELSKIKLYAHTDILLTDAYLNYAPRLYFGTFSPRLVDVEWFAEKKIDTVFTASNALKETLKNQTLENLRNLAPQHKAYKKLLQHFFALKKNKANGGWTKVSSGNTTSIFELDTVRAQELRKRLTESKDLKKYKVKDIACIDTILVEALKNFQKRHGLTINGKLDKETTFHLNISVEEKINTVLLNLERWRWLPEFPKKYVHVNIPSFMLDVMNEDSSEIRMKAVVGKLSRKTPVLSGDMTYLHVNPTWTIPPTILKEDILPSMSKDNRYLERKGIKIIGKDSGSIHPDSINWIEVDPEEFRQEYSLVQPPSKDNALGTMKFMFPNKHSIYIHDTPNKKDFRKSYRAYSSGCIRIEKPVELACSLLNNDSTWTYEKLKNTAGNGNSQKVDLEESIKVHILYWTAFVDIDGELHFRKDIYRKDKMLMQAFDEKREVEKN